MNGIEYHFKYRNNCWILIAIGLAIIMSNCTHTVTVKHEIPKAHLWSRLCGAGEETSGYATYTYVLINRSKADTEAWNRHRELVNSIKWSIAEKAYPIRLEDRSLYNLFLIPEKCEDNQSADTLNDILCKSILTSIAASVPDHKLRDRINTNPGPFLISAIEPISKENLNKEIDILYVDLSRTNPDAMPEVVSAYKKRLTSDSIEGIKRFKSIKLSLLNFILDADDYITMVKVVYAGWNKE
jgi:hypothetical protein